MVVILGILLAFILFRTTRNDIHFNEVRVQEIRKMDERDSSTRKRMDSLSIIVKEVATHVDSIFTTQDEIIETEKQNQEAIQHSLEQIKRAQRQMLNQVK